MQTQQDTTLHQKTQPLVTFIITYYNLPVVMLAKCIESILALSLRPYEREIIVVDDGSGTSPLHDLQRFADDIIYLRKNNGGVSTARNQGLLNATGTFVQFMDGDDMLIPNTYEHCLDLVRYGKTDIVMFDFSHTDKCPGDYQDDDVMSGSELMRSQNIQGSVWSYIFRRGILGDLCFTPGINYGEDEEFTPQLLIRADNVVRTTAKAYFYRQHDTSAIGTTTPEAIDRRLDDNLKVIGHLNCLADTLPTPERLAVGRRVAQLTMDYIYNIIMLTRDRQRLDRQLEVLHRQGLFPLPDNEYTTKYKWFSRMTKNSMGLSLLMRLLPLTRKER